MRYLQQTLAAVLADRLIYAVVAIYVICGAAYVTDRGGTVFVAFDSYFGTIATTYLVLLPAIVLIIGVVRITHYLDRRRGIAYRHMLGPRRVSRFIAGTLLMVVALPPFQSTFAAIKNTIATHGFTFERAAADLDRLLHFRDPDQYLYSFAKNEWVLKAIEFNYDVCWFIACFGMLYWVAISPKADGIRTRYCLTFIAIWLIVGNVAATLFPSAGPVYYGFVTDDPGRFRGVRDFVGSSSGWFASAADAQNYLWLLYSRGLSGLGSGISAFPSVHVALIAFNALIIGERSVRAAIVAWAYVVLIMVSSVYLGWHYAIDGYAAVVLAVAVTWAVKRQMPFLEAVAALKWRWRREPRPAADAVFAADPAE